MKILRFFPLMLVVGGLGCLTTMLGAQTVSTLYSFNGTDGDRPYYVVPTQGRDGKLYGTTATSVSTDGDGTAWQLSTAGELKVLHTFTSASGNWPNAGLTLGTDGNFYGTTLEGGSTSAGVLFRLTPAGVYTVLHEFQGGSDGQAPYAAPIEASDGNLYGTTFGGTSADSTVYKYTRAGAFSTIHVLTGTEGSNIEIPLIQAADGNLYGTATGGGLYGCGTLFKMSLAGQMLHTYSFCSPSELGWFPLGLIQGNDGNFYGTTQFGGINGGGTVFKVDSYGRVTTLYSFNSASPDPSQPVGLVQGTDSNLYGATYDGGDGGYAGILFQLTTTGSYELLYNFGGGGRAWVPPGQYTTGIFYGVTSLGGAYGDGEVYSLSTGLGPFVAFVVPTAKVGQTAQILSQGLTGTTAVTFNGIAAAKFTVVSDTYMTAVVPSGATTGPVVVTTPGGALTSNVSFRISN